MLASVPAPSSTHEMGQLRGCGVGSHSKADFTVEMMGTLLFLILQPTPNSCRKTRTGIKQLNPWVRGRSR